LPYRNQKIRVAKKFNKLAIIIESTTQQILLTGVTI